MRRLPRWLLNAGMVIGSSLLTLIVLEIYLRLFAPQPLNLYNFTLVNEPGIVGHTGGPNPATFYRVETKPPGRGPMVPNTHARLGSVDVVVNANGWRDRLYAPRAAPGTYRIAVVGDSVTLGYAVALSETYHKRLEERLNQAGAPRGRRFEVVAMAGGGGTTYDALRMVRRHLGYFQPRELWLAFNLNDILFPPYKLGEEEADATARIEAAPPLRVRVMLLLGWLREQADAWLRPHSHAYHLLRQRAKVLLRGAGIYTPSMQPEAAFAFSSPQAQGAWAATRAAIVEMRDESARHGVRFAMLMLPADPQTSPATAEWYRRQFHFRFDEDFAVGVVQQRICQEMAALDIECVDALPLFRAHPDEQLFLRIYGDNIDWLHTNASGHELLAEALFAPIQGRLLPDPVPAP